MPGVALTGRTREHKLIHLAGDPTLVGPDRGRARRPRRAVRVARHARRGVTPPLIVLGGATATGKTGLAIELAEALIAEGRSTEVISADSRQVYRGLDIATAKATPADRARVVHHGLDLADPDEVFTVAAFNVHVAGVLATLAARDGIAILAGGTGFYLRSVMQGLDTARLPADPAIRAQVRADLEADGLERTYDRLVELRARARRLDRTVEPEACRTSPRDRPHPGRRRAAGPDRAIPGPLLALGLAVDADAHAARIAARARAQFAAG